MNALRASLVALLFACSHPPEVATVEQVHDRRTDAGASAIGAPIGAPAVLVTDEIAGARLRPVFERLDAADGAVLLRHDGWWDLERDAPCTFVEARDGRTRCLTDGVIADDELASFVTLVPGDTGTSVGGRLRLVHTTWIGSDGARAVTTRVIDTERNEVCRHGRDAEGAERCLPPGAPVTEHDLPDATCTRPALSVPRSEPPPPYVARIDTDACLATAIFPAIMQAPCPDRGDGFRYFAEGLPAAIPPTAFAALGAIVRDAEPGYYGTPGGRLVLRRSGETAEGFERLDPPELFDTTAGERCVPALLDDEQLHCVTAWDYLAFGRDIHANASCTDPVVGVRRSTCAPARRFLARWPRTRGEAMTLLARGPRLAAVEGLWEQDAAGACVRASWLDPALYDVFRVAELVPAPASQFVILRRSTMK